MAVCAGDTAAMVKQIIPDSGANGGEDHLVETVSIAEPEAGEVDAKEQLGISAGPALPSRAHGVQSEAPSTSTSSRAASVTAAITPAQRRPHSRRKRLSFGA